MKEDLLQFIWKFRYFNSHSLKSVDGSDLLIIHPGTQNFDQGPDFLNAQIEINGTLWVGNVELHLFSKQWDQHHHQHDENYKNVILHVVWHHDGDIKDINGTILPTLELEKRVSKILLNKYQALMEKEQKGNAVFIPCENHLGSVSELVIASWKSRLVAERLTEKTKKIFEVLKQTEFHWEETLWRLVAQNFGGKVNGMIFHKIAETIPQNLLARHKNQLIAIESMLFGQAHLLDGEFAGDYPKMLQREYQFYQKKYHLTDVDGNVLFLRMRPANFPTIRLAQLAALILKSVHLFAKIKECNNLVDLKELLKVEPNDYWLYHYKFDDEGAAFRRKALGKQMIENIIINTFAPMMFAYGLFQKEETYKEKAIQWLEEITPEKNSITQGFERIGIANKSAFDSQALIQLKNYYCNETRCLQCAIGNAILKNESQN